jgi:integrase
MGVHFLVWMLATFRGGGPPRHHISTSIRYYYAVMPRIPLAMLEARCHGRGADTLADVYGTALDAVTPRGQAYVFGRLQLFHAAMQVDYGLPDVDWADVVPLTLVGTCGVDAGVVTYDEYHAALEALHADPQADERTRSLQAWVLVVTYRFGLRISEALGLRRKDLWLDDALPVVLVRPNAYRDLKSDAGQRVVPLIGALSPLERQVVDDWIGYVDAHCADDPEAALTGTRDDARSMVETEALRRRLRDALHGASRDSSVHLHHLRHAYAMRLQLVMTLETIPSDRRFRRAVHRVLGPTDLQATRDLLLDSRSLSHRGLSAARVLVGHASVGVYRRSYAHLDDLVSAAWLEPVFHARRFEVDDRVLSYLLGTPARCPPGATVRRCMSVSMMDRVTAGALARTTAMVRARRRSIVLPHRTPQFQAPLRLRDIDRVLDIVHRRRSLDGLDALTMWPIGQLAQMLAAEHAVREASRYDIAGSGWPPTTATRSVSHMRAGRRLLHETRRTTPLLKHLESLLADAAFLGACESVCALWRRHYRPDATPWVLATTDQVAVVLSWCLAVGIKPGQMCVRVPRDIDDGIDPHAWRAKGLDEIAREQCQGNVLPRVRRGSAIAAASTTRRYGVLVHENDQGPVIRMTQLNRVMHVLSTWIALRADRGSTISNPNHEHP